MTREFYSCGCVYEKSKHTTNSRTYMYLNAHCIIICNC